MPSLRLFNHRTSVAGDDLRCHSTFAILLRLLQVALLVPAMIYLVRINADPMHCESSGILRHGHKLFYTYWVCSVVLVFFSLPIDYLIFRTSGRGTPSQPAARAWLRPLCYIKIVPLSLLRITTFGLGVVVAVFLKQFCTCATDSIVDPTENLNALLAEIRTFRCPDYDSMMVVLPTLIATHASEVMVATIIYFYFVFKTVRPGRWLRPLLGTPEFRWEAFCCCCCTLSSVFTCCMFGGWEVRNSSFADISLALAEFLDDGGNLDVTLSDLVAGVMMVAREHKEKWDRTRGLLVEKVKSSRHHVAHSQPSAVSSQYTHSNIYMLRLKRIQEDRSMAFEVDEREPLCVHNISDVDVVQEGAYYMRFALAIYGYIMYVMNHRMEGLCCLTAQCAGCFRSCCTEEVIGDNMCGCNASAFLRETGMEVSCLAYFSCRSGVGKIPYCIVVDKEKRSVVVAIRGTLAIEDVVADLTIHPTLLAAFGQQYDFVGDNAYAHSGMLKCAEWIAEDMRGHGILRRLLLDERSDTSDFRLVVTGHSLGAGCAAILSLFLRKDFPCLRCFCFEPPGCVLSDQLADFDWMISFVLGDDIVPRLSFESLKNLRDDVLSAIQRLKVPKHKVFEIFQPLNWKKYSDHTKWNRRMLHRTNSTPQSEFGSQLSAFRAHQHERAIERGMAGQELHPPGKIIHLVKASDTSSSTRPFLRWEKDAYVPVWAKRKDICEINLSGSLLLDHHAGKVCTALQRIAASFGEKSPVAGPGNVCQA